MLTVNRTFLVLLCASLMLGGSLACSTSEGQTADDSSEPAQSEPAQSGQVAKGSFEPEVQKFALDGPVPMVLKVHMQGVDEIAALGAVVEAGMLGGRAAPAVAEFQRLGAVALMSSVVPTGDYVDQIDRERPSYIAREVLADDSYWTALRYGAVYQPAQVTPYGVHTRFLLPTANPEKLAEAMGTNHSKNRDDMRAVVTPAERFVIVDMVEFGRPVDRAAVMKEVKADTADDQSAELRRTPALVRFAQSDAPVSAYFRSEDFRLDAGAMGMFEAMQALEHASPMNRAQMLALGGAMGLYALMMAPVSEIDHEDSVLEVRADDADGIVFDATSTLTERGRKIATAAGDELRVRTTPSGSETASPLASVRWNYDVARMASKVPSAFADVLNESKWSGYGTDALSEMLRTGGWRGYTEVLLVSPSFFARAGSASVPNQLGSLFPVAGALELQRSAPSAPISPDHMSLAGAILFGDSDAKAAATPYLDQLRQMAKGMNVPVKLEFADSDPGEARLEVRAGAATKGETTHQVSLDAASIVAEAELEPLLAHQAGPQAASALADLTKVRFQFDHGPTVSRLRVHFGTGELATAPVAEVEDFAPAKAGPLCVDTLAARSLQTFEAMASMNPQSWGADAATLLDHYDTAARECAKEQPQHEEALKLARARMRSMLHMRASMVDNAAAKAGLEKSACDLGDEVQCQ